jgi:preprotein translocase subunit SecF
MKFFNEEPSFNIVGKIGHFAKGSGVAVSICALLLVSFGLNFGIDFAGGYEIQVKFPKSISESEIRAALKPVLPDEPKVQRFGAVSENEYLILIREQGTIPAEQKANLQKDFEALAGSADGLTNWAIAESGERITVGFAAPTDEAAVRDVLSRYGFTVKEITRGDREDQPEYSIRIVSLSDHVEDALRVANGVPKSEKIVNRVEFVGPQVGAELRNQGIMAIVYALGFILLYIAIRFDLAFAPGAVVALIHDVMITMGVFSLFQLEFNLPIIAAILAIVGYSLNDTIVVYDRIRENALRYRGRGLRDLVNTSLNQTLSRTVLTSLTTMLVVSALLFFGGGIIRDFAIALAVGIMVGTYSSVAIASPVYILLRERSEEKAASAGKKTKSATATA